MIMAKAKKASASNSEQSNEEKIGFHKGSLSVLAKERQEMQRILSIVEQLMQMHLTELKGMGVDLQEEVEKAKASASDSKQKKPPIDELL